MRVKGMLLKNSKVFIYFLLIIFFLFTRNTYSSSDEKLVILTHLNSLKNFSASFLQNDGENLSEGKVYIGEKRVRAEYFLPSKILIILDEDKAMYYNYELEEDEFFNPKNTSAWFFYDIFRNPLFFEDGIISTENKELVIKKTGSDIDENDYQIIVYFEQNPLVLRAVEIITDDAFLKLSIYNHNYNEEFDKSFFKLINPSFLN